MPIYTKEQENDIYQALKAAGLKGGIKKAFLIKAISRRAQLALASKVRQSSPKRNPRPTAGKIQSELRGLAKACSSFIHVLTQLSSEAQTIIEGQFTNFYEPDELPLIGKLGIPRTTLALIELEQLLKPNLNKKGIKTPPIKVSNFYPSVGRPRNKALRNFTFDLCPIYHIATGKMPKRHHDGVSVKDSGPFHRFAEAAILPLDLIQKNRRVDTAVEYACAEYRFFYEEGYRGMRAVQPF